MDSFEWNKLAGAVLGSILAVLIIHKIIVIVFDEPELAQAAYVVDTSAVDGGGHGGAGPAVAEEKPLGVLFAEVDAAKGEKVFGNCKSCHTYEKGGKILQGPNLWGVVGRQVAHSDEFDSSKGYSPAMKEDGGTWSPEHLFAFLESPRKVIPKTKMNFGGLRKPEDRAALIAFLNQQSDSPVELPKAEMKATDAMDATDGSMAPADGAPAPAHNNADGPEQPPMNDNTSGGNH